MYKLSEKSLSKLDGVNRDLVRVVKRAITISKVDFGISEGVRSAERQQELYDSLASKTLNSKHLTGDAIDLFAYVDGGVTWQWIYYEQIAIAMYTAAMKERVLITWGGSWDSLKDGPHFQIR